MININMRCIEMRENFVSLRSQCGININMRCIEITL